MRSSPCCSSPLPTHRKQPPSRLSVLRFIHVAAAISLASDGDTVMIPSGTASWTLGITVTKDITIQGKTTVNSDDGTANDQTIILDDMLSNNIPAIAMSPVTGKTVRVTGITFKPGTRNNSLNGGIVSLGGTTQATAVRLDHCHFIGMHRIVGVFVNSAVYGVIDHNLFENPSNLHRINFGADAQLERRYQFGR